MSEMMQQTFCRTLPLLMKVLFLYYAVLDIYTSSISSTKQPSEPSWTDCKYMGNFHQGKFHKETFYQIVFTQGHSSW